MTETLVVVWPRFVVRVHHNRQSQRLRGGNVEELSPTSRESQAVVLPEPELLVPHTDHRRPLQLPEEGLGRRGEWSGARAETEDGDI